jgi:hypothetical protein
MDCSFNFRAWSSLGLYIAYKILLGILFWRFKGWSFSDPNKWSHSEAGFYFGGFSWESMNEFPNLYLFNIIVNFAGNSADELVLMNCSFEFRVWTSLGLFGDYWILLGILLWRFKGWSFSDPNKLSLSEAGFYFRDFLWETMNENSNLHLFNIKLNFDGNSADELILNELFIQIPDLNFFGFIHSILN